MNSGWTDYKLVFHICNENCLVIEGIHVMATLEPVKVNDLHRVPIFRKGENYVIWTGNGAVRYFKPDDLPDFIKVRLGIVFNSIHAAELNAKDMSDADMSKGSVEKDLFNPSRFGEEYEEIGWQYNKYYYVVVMSGEELASLRGAGTPKFIDAVVKST